MTKKERIKRAWHPDFIKYMKSIAKHYNYAGMPEPYKEDGSVRWIVTGKSAIGQERERWWDDKRKGLGIEKKPGWKALVARRIHPAGEKPCQICGKVLKLDYVYPNKNCPYQKNVLEECDRNNCDRFLAHNRGHNTYFSFFLRPALFF